jgi:hypothetical protein
MYRMTAVILTQHDQIEQAIGEALSYLQLDLLIRDKIVAVKPNDTWPSLNPILYGPSSATSNSSLPKNSSSQVARERARRMRSLKWLD